ncbi:MAG: transcriptional repressor [Magnetococcales bacterium]|nr:transcriptional repressor [Magnetococcales bacterium]
MKTPFPNSSHDHEHCRKTILQRADTVCREKGGRLTPNRREVLAILSNSHRSLGAYDILERFETNSSRRPAPSAVYRSLEFLMEMGLVHRLGSRNAFFACMRPELGNQTQFWICQDCGVVGETESQEIANTLPSLAENMGFKLAQVHLEIEGTCPECQVYQESPA